MVCHDNYLNQDGFGRHKFLVFWSVYVQHKNIIAEGWQQTREQKHVGCQFAPGATSPRSPPTLLHNGLF